MGATCCWIIAIRPAIMIIAAISIAVSVIGFSWSIVEIVDDKKEHLEGPLSMIPPSYLAIVAAIFFALFLIGSIFLCVGACVRNGLLFWPYLVTGTLTSFALLIMGIIQMIIQFTGKQESKDQKEQQGPGLKLLYFTIGEIIFSMVLGYFTSVACRGRKQVEDDD
ncbi:hypothetical protein M3Y98_00678000 [Aphelenchoides besseyi]|nr:hypothetical protein M3Y98_00678000 [Aphelenchoides besseyi]